MSPRNAPTCTWGWNDEPLFAMRATGSPARTVFTPGYRYLADMDVGDMDIRRFAVDQLLEPDGARASGAHDAGGRGFHDTARKPFLRA